MQVKGKEHKPKVDYRRIDAAHVIDAEFPASVSTEYRVHLSAAAHQRMSKHAATTNEVELCGVLIGDVARDRHGFFLQIVDVIEGEKANNYGAQVTFTHETWSHINAVKDRLHADRKIVGWYHTHPGFGVFLSSMDTFIQENFFNQPYQVAIVLETVKKVEGCFSWVDGAPQPLRRYWVEGREVSLATGDADPVDVGHPHEPRAVPAATTSDDRPRQPLRVLSLTMLMVAVLLGFLLGRLFGLLSFEQKTRQALETEIYSALETIGFNQLAADDLGHTADRLAQLSAELAPVDSGAATKVLGLATEVTTVRSDYERQRATWRKNLEQLAFRRQGLSTRLDDAIQRQDEQTLLLGRLHLLRIADLLTGRAPEQLSTAERQSVNASLDRLVRLIPNSPRVIRERFPGLLESLRAPVAASGATAAPSPISTRDR